MHVSTVGRYFVLETQCIGMKGSTLELSTSAKYVESPTKTKITLSIISAILVHLVKGLTRIKKSKPSLVMCVGIFIRTMSL